MAEGHMSWAFKSGKTDAAIAAETGPTLLAVKAWRKFWKSRGVTVEKSMLAKNKTRERAT